MSQDTTMEEYDFSGSMGADVAKESGKGGDFQRELEFLSLRADQASINQGKNQAIVRLCTEYEMKPHMAQVPPEFRRFALPWITVAQHYAPTKQKPPYAKEGQRWPEKMYCVCRKDKVFAKKFSDQCPVCANGIKSSNRTWALAVEREQVIEDGRVLGIRDKMREVSIFGSDGQPIVERVEGDKKIYAKKWVPAYLILNFGWKNFFNALAGQASYHKTVMGRDYVVSRTGTDNNDTTYAFIPLDPIVLGPDNPWGVQGGTPYDLSLVLGEENGRPVTLLEKVYPDLPDLRKIVADRTSEEYYGRWFIPGWLPEGFDPNAQQNSGQQGVQTGYMGGYTPQGGQQQGQQQGYQPQQPQAPATPDPQNQQTGPSADALQNLKNRMMGQPQQPPQEEQQNQQAQPAGQPQQ